MTRGSPESPYACLRLGASLLLMTIGGVGMYSMAVALAPVQAEFSADRGGASLPYTLTMIGFGFGGILMGRLSDRFGVFVPVVIGGVSLGVGFIAAGMAPSLLQFTLVHGLLIGLLGCSATFAPLVADTRRVQAGFDRIASLRPRFICVNDDLPDDADDDHPSRRAFTDWMDAAYPTPSAFERPP